MSKTVHYTVRKLNRAIARVQQQVQRPYTVYVINGNSWGDEGKGKVMRHYLCEAGGRVATKCLRYNGGPNAGHTVVVRPDDPHLLISDEQKQKIATLQAELDAGQRTAESEYYLTLEKTKAYAEYYGKTLKGDKSAPPAKDLIIEDGRIMLKFATHQIPTGAIFGIKSIIGYGVVVDIVKLHNEIKEVSQQLGRSYQEIADLITIAPEAHVILPEHINRDRANDAVGTTGSGIGPVYADKALRTGFRMQTLYDFSTNPQFQTILDNIDALAPEYFGNDRLVQLAKFIGQIKTLNATSFAGGQIVGVRIAPIKDLAASLQQGDVIVMEGAQGFQLCTNHGQYPYCTSSPCTIAAAMEYGFELASYHPVGCTKAYTTYVGKQILEKGFEYNVKHKGVGALLRYFGKEYGVTTGRARQCLPLNLDEELDALRINQTRDWIISKSDVLTESYAPMLKLLETIDKDRTYGAFLPNNTPNQQTLFQFINDTWHNDLTFDENLYKEMVRLGAFQVVHQGVARSFGSWEEMKAYIVRTVEEADLPNLDRIVWWDTADSEVAMAEEKIE